MKLFATTQHSWTQRRSLRLILVILSFVALGSLVFADGHIIRVARLSLIEGDVSYQRAHDSRGDWFDAAINMPLDENDQVFTGTNGRAEIQLTGRNLVRINHDTNLKITQFNTGTTQLALSVGTAIFRIDSLDRRQFEVVDARDGGNDDPIYFEVDTPTVAVTLLKEGVYRINVRDDGTTEVIVRHGAAEVYNQEFGSVAVKQGRRIVVDGKEADSYQLARLEDKDEWDRWNDRRDEELLARSEAHSLRYVPVGVPGVYDLDRYGEWWSTPEYGYVWSPRVIAAGWAPYRSGYWCWYPAYGWTWVSYEPWGWAPYHYGRWAYYRSRWCWVPHGGLSVGFAWSWSPALVTFFGVGSGYRQGYRDGFGDGYRRGYRDGAYDWVGWVPLAPGEHYYGHTTINNTVGPPRAIGSLKNYSAPGGVTGLEGRHFINPRVAVNNYTPPPKISDPNTKLGPIPVRGDLFKPTQPEIPRVAPMASAGATRQISSPVVTRRGGSLATPSGTMRTVEGGVPTMRGAGVVQGGEVNRTPSRRELPTREGHAPVGPTSTPSLQVTPPTHDRTERSKRQDGQSLEFPARRPDYHPVERPDPPRRREGGGNNGYVEPRESPRPLTAPRRESGPPSESRPVEPAPRRVEPPARPPAEHRVPPATPSEHREPPARTTPQPSAPRESHRPDPPPARSGETAAPRGERPSSPSSERATPGRVRNQ